MAADLDALLLAAGFGTRLRPLTDRIPKALLPICGRELLDIHLERLLRSGGPARQVVVNTHHLAEMMRRHIEGHALRDRIGISHEPEILGTGGAIPWAAEHLRSDPIILVNADGLIDPPFQELIDFHARSGCEGTLLLVRDPFAPNVHVEGERIVRISTLREEEAFTFTGCQAISQAFVRRIPKGGFHDIRETYSALIEERKLAAFVWDPEPRRPFIDIGTPALYLHAHRLFVEGGISGFKPALSDGFFAAGYGWIDDAARIAPGASIEESVILGAVEITRPVRIRRSIVVSGASIAKDLEGMLVTGWGERPIEDPRG